MPSTISPALISRLLTRLESATPAQVKSLLREMQVNNTAQLRAHIHDQNADELEKFVQIFNAIYTHNLTYSAAEELYNPL